MIQLCMSFSLVNLHNESRKYAQHFESGCLHDADCKNGGVCTEYRRRPHKVCICPKGTTGNFCQDFIDCGKGKILDCGQQADCAYDRRISSVYCRCKNISLAFDIVAKKCRAPCKTDADCRGDQICTAFGIQSQKTCHCKKGSICKQLVKCEIEHNLDCGQEAQCMYDHDMKQALCLCKENMEFDFTSKTCKSKFCKPSPCIHGTCVDKGNDFMCICQHPYTGRLCEIENKCITKSCHNGSCKIVDDKETCICPKGSILQNDACIKENKCLTKKCFNGTCKIIEEKEACFCPEGLVLRNDTCIKDGKCRPDTCYGGTCKDNVCVCPKGFQYRGIGCFERQCERRNCYGGKCYVFEDGHEECECSEGYELREDICTKINK